VPGEVGASSLDSAIFFLHLGRARESVADGRFEDARREIELARLERPDDEGLLNLVSIVEFRLGDFGEAARAARALLEKKPESAVLHANLGLIQFKAGALEDAEREFRRAVELDPDHPRSHLYLGLLSKSRGELPLALEHFRRSGALKAAAEIEETLGLAAPGPLLAEVPAAAREEEPAARDSSALEPEDRPLFRVRGDGTLAVASRGLVHVRRGAVSWFSGRLRFAEDPAFAESALERLLRCEGTGDLLLRDPGRRAVCRGTSGEALFLEGTRLLAVSPGMRLRLETIRDFRTRRRVDVLKIQGRGAAVFTAAGEIEAHDVSAGFPLTLCAEDLVAWTGDLAPSVVEDRYLEEVMVADPGDAPRLRFEGEGVVLTEGPRADW
jgi:tetratricopeptide (TPR) repeat protein